MKPSISATLVALTLGTAATAFVTPSDARLVQLQITTREVVAGGMAFGETGQYEKLTGTAYFEADPDDPRNARVFDINRTVRNKRGMVEFSADAVILKPVDMSKANGALYFEVNNRGNKISLNMLLDTAPGTNGNNPIAVADFGNGFLLRKGYVIAWVGWGADIAPGGEPHDGRLSDCHEARGADHRADPHRILGSELRRGDAVLAAAVGKPELQAV